jgi:hypothetical protein
MSLEGGRLPSESLMRMMMMRRRRRRRRIKEGWRRYTIENVIGSGILSVYGIS